MHSRSYIIVLIKSFIYTVSFHQIIENDTKHYSFRILKCDPLALEFIDGVLIK